MEFFVNYKYQIVLLSLVFSLFFGCASAPYNPANFESYVLNEKNYREFLTKNANSIDPIEGIWSVNFGATYNPNPMYSRTEYLNYSTVAIVRDTITIGRDFFESVIYSDKWHRGAISGHFSKTAYPKVYISRQYNLDGSFDKYNFILENSGVLRSSKIKDNFTLETYYIKIFPAINNEESIFPNDEKIKSTGSGFVLTETGLIVTNWHVVDNNNSIEVYFPQKEKTFKAEIVLKDVSNDVAILRLKDFEYSKIFNDSIPFTIIKSNKSKLGQDVFTLGFPLGDILGKSVKLSTGTLNSLNGLKDDPRLFQISTPVQPGNSGGALFNNNGEIVGIVVASLNAKYFYENEDIIPQNVNFAVKSDYLLNLISMLPEEKSIINRKNQLVGLKLEKQIEKISPFIVTIKVK